MNINVKTSEQCYSYSVGIRPQVLLGEFSSGDFKTYFKNLSYVILVSHIEFPEHFSSYDRARIFHLDPVLSANGPCEYGTVSYIGHHSVHRAINIDLPGQLIVIVFDAEDTQQVSDPAHGV